MIRELEGLSVEGVCGEVGGGLADVEARADGDFDEAEVERLVGSAAGDFFDFELDECGDDAGDPLSAFADGIVEVGLVLAGEDVVDSESAVGIDVEFLVPAETSAVEALGGGLRPFEVAPGVLLGGEFWIVRGLGRVLAGEAAADLVGAVALPDELEIRVVGGGGGELADDGAACAADLEGSGFAGLDLDECDLAVVEDLTSGRVGLPLA